MIPRPTIRGIAGLSALVALSFWLHQDKVQDTTTAIRGLDTRLNYVLHDFKARYFDNAGQLAGLVEAPLLTNDANTGIGRMEQPRFEVVHQENQWTIRSESATLTPERDQVMFNGAVSMRRQPSDTREALEVRASAVILEVDPRIAHSGEAVAILEGKNVLNAKGFRVDMTDDRFQLLSDVRGHYVIQ